MNEDNNEMVRKTQVEMLLLWFVILLVVTTRVSGFRELHHLQLIWQKGFFQILFKNLWICFQFWGRKKIATKSV